MVGEEGDQQITVLLLQEYPLAEIAIGQKIRLSW
jgi:hypothetical protein